MSFFNDLRRRDAFKASTAYLVVAWLVAQNSDTSGNSYKVIAHVR